MFKKSDANQIMDDILAAVKDVESKHNITIHAQGGSIGVTDMTLKFKVVTADKEAMTDAMGPFATMLGLPKDIIGKKFQQKASEFEIIRLDPNKIKYPIIARNQNGTTYKFSVDQVKQLMNI